MEFAPINLFEKLPIQTGTFGWEALTFPIRVNVAYVEKDDRVEEDRYEQPHFGVYSVSKRRSCKSSCTQPATLRFGGVVKAFTLSAHD